jgi:hypothetical protein
VIENFMPHSRKPLGYALSLLRKSAYHDRELQEHINRTDKIEYNQALKAEFPQLDPDTIIEYLPVNAVIGGLVLNNARGEGALEQQGKPPQHLTVEAWCEQMRLHAYEKHGVL